VWNVSCSSWQETTRTDTSATAPTSSSDPYTAAFPQRDISASLQDVQQSMVRITTTVFYNTYTFNKPRITSADIQTNEPAAIASQQFSSEESTAGTSVMLDLNNSGDALLITCAHVVTAPDTLISYFEEDDTIPADTFIESISIKRRQSNLIFTSGELSTFNIIAQDDLSDIALLNTNLGNKMQEKHFPLRFSMGRSERLQLGSFLYILGFPKGFPMITRGIVSTKGLKPHRFFITDALFNQGISGGLVISSNDNFNSFEWVGLARSATASREQILVPKPDIESENENRLYPYNDQVYIDYKDRISYGITQVVPIDKIRSFIQENRSLINSLGFSY
jgi:S1-C subfamily serine protease